MGDSTKNRSTAEGSRAESKASDRPRGFGVMHGNMADFEGGGVANIDLIHRRAEHLSGSVLFYHDPVWLVRGEGVWMFDQNGKRYLDCYNNVPSVGHCNPRVFKALSDQAQVLNTHTRYLHESVIDYAEQLAATFPDPLNLCLFVCTGTEANELAMRIARTVTGNNGAIVMEYAYHGNSTLISELSTAGSRKEHRPEHVVAVEPPNCYRGPFADDPQAGAHYADLIDEAISVLAQRGQGTAAFMCDTMFDSQGGLEAPQDYFSKVYEKVHAAGGLCIADEVQPGFARTGKMWGFEHYNVVPDIVTLGKPMGNGHPLAGVVTSREIAERFSQSSFYFNTFGGNPVSAAVGKAVLDEIAERQLPEHVADVGGYLRLRLEDLAQKHSVIGNVHGLGLYQALDLVTDRATKDPASELASKIPDALKAEGVLIGLSGRFGNVLKIRPPLVFDRNNVDQLIESLDLVLSRLS
ncbi:MAG: aminotransferase class III-fold pyridoxal phosphate-dependent enzyme [Pseudomonadales bacterium]